MSDADRNVAVLKDAYKKWSDTLGSSVDDWMSICAEQISFGSIAEGPPGAAYLTQFQSRDALKEYFAGLERDFALLVRERPHPQFLLGDLPQARQACRLYDQKQHD